MPGRPQETQQDTWGKRITLQTHFGERIAHPANFLQETGGNTKKDAHEKAIGGIHRGDKCFQQKENGQDQNGRNEKRDVPPCGKPPPTYSSEKVPYTVFPIYDPRESDACNAWPEEHSRKHQDASQLWQRLAGQEMRCGHREGTYPRDRKRQHKVAGDRIASDDPTGFLHRGTIAQAQLISGQVRRLPAPTPQPKNPLSYALFRPNNHAEFETQISEENRDLTRQNP